MNKTLIWQLAIRYLTGKRTANIVPVLSRISMVAIAVSSAAMIVVFSVFNGLEGFVKQLYNGFYPDVKVTVAKGKFFKADTTMVNKMYQVPGVKVVTAVIEDNAIVNNTNNKEQKVVIVKGIDRNYLAVNNIRASISGEDSVSAGNPYTAIAGARILNELSADMNNIFSTIELYYANPEQTNFAAAPDNAYRSLELHPAGMFQISDDFDDKYILAPLQLVQHLFHKDGQYSSLEISVEHGKTEEVKAALGKLVGANYKVESRYEQNKTMFMVLRTEKWAIYAILVMVLLVASFNLVGGLTMMVLEKQKDIAILKAMGAGSNDIKAVFLMEGILWAMSGGISGIVLGTLVCVAQQQFGIITVGGSFLMDAYPVDMNAADFLLVFVTILAVGLLAAWYPATKATKAPAPALKGV